MKRTKKLALVEESHNPSPPICAERATFASITARIKLLRRLHENESLQLHSTSAHKTPNNQSSHSCSVGDPMAAPR